MAAGITRFLPLLLVFLCWFVLRGNPVTQEFEKTSQDVPTETAYLSISLQHPTPQLVSVATTEVVISGSVDPNSLTISPSIAPATPWEDSKIASTVSNVFNEESEDTRTEKHNPEVEEIQNEKLEGKIKSKIVDERINEGARKGSSEALNYKTSADGDFDVKKTVKNLDSSAEKAKISSVPGSGIDNGESDDKADRKQNLISQNEDSEGNSQDQTEQAFRLSEEVVAPKETPLSDPNQNGNEKVHKSEIVVDGNIMVDGSKILDEGAQESYSEVDDDPVATPDDGESQQENMPSFKEWSQKFLEQEEQKNKVQLNEKGGSESNAQPKKKSDRKQNNYASVDCGAKILEKNPEAQNAESILLENKDLYMLNPCSANIWFIVELCDHVQVTSLQLANFELFSSTIEKFQVSFSTRYPSREWTQLQTFTAKPEKTVQTFTLDPIFAKYIRVEQLGYHGSEHYCPWSLLRVYGNSMVEEYEEHESSSHETDSSLEEEESTSSGVKEDEKVSKGILKSATDAVFNFVKETAKKLVSSEEVTTNSSTASISRPNSTNFTGNTSLHMDSENPKAIVELMHREDFDAHCHEVTDGMFASETKCLSKSVCGSTKYKPHSYEIFIEIIRNVCPRDLKSAEDCFVNLTKILARNKSSETRGLKVKRLEKQTVPEEAPKTKRDTFHERGTQVKVGSLGDVEEIGKPSDLHSGSPVKASEEVNTNREKSSQKSTSSFHSTSSVQTEEVEKDNENIQVSPVIHSSTISASDGSSSDSGYSGSISTSSTRESIKRPSSPTPLAPPPLAVNEEPDSEDKENSVINKLQQVFSEVSDIIHTTVTSRQSSASEHVTYDVKDISPENTVLISGKEPTPSLPVIAASVEVDKSKSDPLDQEAGVHVSVKGSNKEKPNPHVDVLKITLTDAETKEGTAELEQADQDEGGLEESSERKTTPAFIEGGIVSERVVPNETASSITSRTTDWKEQSGYPDQKGKVNDAPKSALEEAEPVAGGTRESETEGKPMKQEPNKKNEESTRMERDVKVEKNPEVLDQNMKKDLLGDSSQCEKKEKEDGILNDETTKQAIKKPQVDEANSDSLGTSSGSDSVHSSSASNGQTTSKKESIFVSMSRKIKALEQNVTMTNMFLEELSQRYRKSLDEMQKKLEKKLSNITKNSKLLSKVNLSQNATILALMSRLEKLERELSEATSRLKVVNQEVIERHVLGMCLQFVFVLLLYFILGRARTRRDSPAIGRKQTQQMARKQKVLCNGEVKNHENDKCQIGNCTTKNGNVVEDIAHDKKYVEEFALPKPSLETMAEGKRRRRRRNRPSYDPSDHLHDHEADHGQNIISKTAGLLFHSPGSHEAGNITGHSTKDAAQRSSSTDSLTEISRNRDDRKLNIKRAAVSPKAKKDALHNGGKKENSSLRSRPASFHAGSSKTRASKELNSYTQNKGLARSKSSGDWFENKTSLYNNGSPSSSRCSLQSANDCDQLKNQKSRWIWGLG